MRTLTILTGAATLPHETPARDVIVWNRRSVPCGQGSVPRFLDENMHEIRAELVRWAYDTGRARVQGQEVQEWLCAGDRLSMWWCSLLFEQHPKVMPDLWSALKLRALERMMEADPVPYTVVCLRGNDDRLARVVQDFCTATGRLFFYEHARRTPRQRENGWLTALYYRLPAPCKTLARCVAWLWHKRRMPRTMDTWPSGTYGTIATYFPNIDTDSAAQGRFRSRYWESLHDALENASARIHWLFIAFPSPQYTFAQCLELRDRFRQAGQDTYHYLEEFLDMPAIGRAVRRYCRLLWASARIEAHIRPAFAFAGSRMNLWEYLGPYFADSFRGWRALERCLHREAMRAFVAWAGPQRWTLFPMENCPWERMLTEATHTAGHGTVLGIQHSTVRPTDFRYFDDPRTFIDTDCTLFQPDMILANGQAALAEFRNAGVPEARCGLAEALRYMYLVRREGDNALKRVKYSPIGRVLQGSVPRMLIATSFFADECEDHIRALCDWLHTEHGFAVALKPHPYRDVTPYFRRYDALDIMPPVLTEPVGVLLTPGTVVWASNSTTVALEAALCGLSVLVQTPQDGVDLSPLPSLEGVIRVHTAEDVRTALNTVTRQPQRVADYVLLDPDLPRLRGILSL